MTFFYTLILAALLPISVFASTGTISGFPVYPTATGAPYPVSNATSYYLPTGTGIPIPISSSRSIAPYPTLTVPFKTGIIGTAISTIIDTDIIGTAISTNIGTGIVGTAISTSIGTGIVGTATSTSTGQITKRYFGGPKHYNRPHYNYPTTTSVAYSTSSPTGYSTSDYPTASSGYVNPTGYSTGLYPTASSGYAVPSGYPVPSGYGSVKMMRRAHARMF